ncbi:MAG: cytochrome c oxidase subunit II [Phycisphaerales bacterium]
MNAALAQLAVGLSRVNTLGEGATKDFWRDVWLRGYAASDIGRESDDMFMFLWWFCVAWFVFLMAIVVYFVFRYRARKGATPQRSSAHNTPLEIAWTIIPTIMLVVIFFKGFWSYIDKVAPPGNAIELNLTGFRWSWQLVYPNGAETNEDTTIGSRPVPVFYVPEESNVRFRMNSSDVMHAFWIPDYRIKADLLPNRYTQVWVRTGKAQTPAAGKELNSTDPKRAFLNGARYTDHMVFCAEYCGTEHSEMAAVLRVVPKDVYEKWLEYAGTPDDLVKWGERLYKGLCSSCHSNNGKDGIGPTWKGLRDRDSVFQDGSKLTAADKADEVAFKDYIWESVRQPAKRVVAGKGNNMSPYGPGQLSDEKLNAIFTYIKTLSDAPAAKDAPASKEAPAAK